METVISNLSGPQVRKIVKDYFKSHGLAYAFKVSVKRYAEFDAIEVVIKDVPSVELGTNGRLNAAELKKLIVEASGCRVVQISPIAPPGSKYAYVNTGV